MSRADQTPQERRLSAAELIVIRARARLECRISWLASAKGEDTPEQEREWLATLPPGDAASAENRLTGEEGEAWTRLARLFHLAPAEQELLQLALAVGVEPALGPLIAAAQLAEGRSLPTETLAKRLSGLPARPIWRPTGALAMWALLRPVRIGVGEPLCFEADSRIVDWMFGTVSLDQSLVLAVETIENCVTPREWPVEEIAVRLRRAHEAGADVRLIVEARGGAGRRRYGAAVAHALSRKALIVDPVPIAPADWAENFMRLQRFAFYTGTALVWRSGAPPWPGKIPLAPIQIVCVDEGAAPPTRDGATDIVVSLPEPGVASKASIWRRLAPQLASADQTIATMPGLSLGDLEEAARAAPATVDEATSHLRALARSRMQGVGRVVDPSFDWDDLILDEIVEAKLRRISFEARSRTRVLGDPEASRVFASAASLTALFSGPPGVGKSMAAQVIARDLGINLLVIDLATTTSKYIGETAKNLSMAFARARAAGAALIFEEADALFARRTDVKDSNDRHANADTGHLLQLLEAHDGIAILSTNRRANIDPAFVRRLRHCVEFSRPGVAQSERIWTRALTALGVAVAELGGAAALAARHDLSPAQIKSATLSANYTALATGRAITLADLDQGACAELIKEGRSVSPATITPLRRTRMTNRG
jgi:AAA+ superfamily predicted ATPase